MKIKMTTTIIYSQKNAFFNELKDIANDFFDSVIILRFSKKEQQKKNSMCKKANENLGC